MKYRKILVTILTSVTLAQFAVGAIAGMASAVVGTIEISPDTGPTGSIVSITGQNFTASQSFTVKFGTNAVKTGMTDSAGRLSTTFEVPVIARGQYSVTVTTLTDTSSTKYHTVTPQVKTGTTSGRVGDQIFISGTGFRANVTVTFSLDSTNAGTVTSDSSGTFTNASLTVPAVPKGEHSLTARDASGSSPGVTFTVAQVLSVTPAAGTVGDKVVITGKGFAAGLSIIMTLDSEPVNAAATTDADGSYTYNFTVPPLQLGKHTIEAKDSAGNAASAEILVTNKLGIAPVTGTPGTVVRISGDGFRADMPIEVRYNSLAVATTPSAIVSSIKGSFSASFEVPGGLTGTYLVEVSDGVNTASASFQATIEATINQVTTTASPGYVGMELTVSGSGFKPVANVTVSRDAVPAVVLATTASDSMGSFAATFAMPPTPSGAHTLTVTDGTSTSLLTFVMEATAPSVPRPLVPEEGTRPSRPVRFDWKDVSDPSGVLYSLQVATDEKFEHIGLDKEDIAGSEYKLTRDENLKSVTKQTPYFWRVKAIDRAGNEGDWSEVNAFHLGFVLTLPNGETDWTMSALTAYIAGLVTMAAIGFTFWLGRRSVRRGAPVNPNNTPGSLRDDKPTDVRP